MLSGDSVGDCFDGGPLRLSMEMNSRRARLIWLSKSGSKGYLMARALMSATDPRGGWKWSVKSSSRMIANVGMLVEGQASISS